MTDHKLRYSALMASCEEQTPTVVEKRHSKLTKKLMDEWEMN